MTTAAEHAETASPASEARSGAKPSEVNNAGFTLIELVAVVTILVLIGAVVLPRLSLGASQSALDDGKRLAATLEYAREQAISLGFPHRVVLDLELDSYWVEALPRAENAAQPLAWAELDELPLAPPRVASAAFVPLGGALGKPARLHGNVHFNGVETDSGDVTESLAALTFAPEGGTAAAHIRLVTDDELHLSIDVAPLTDPMRVSFDAAP